MALQRLFSFIKSQKPKRVRKLKKRSNDEKFPIFIISFNRADYLLQVVKSYKALESCGDIVVRDNGSDDPRTLDVLDNLASEGVTVVRAGKIGRDEDLNNIDETVQQYFKGRKPTRYVVTDCDIDMSIAGKDTLQVYSDFLDLFPDLECAGPMLRISDIPEEYTLYATVMNRHIEQFWHREPDWIELRGTKTAYQPALIDTTFALHRAGEPFRRLKKGARVYYPHEALHLDWYPTDGLQSITYAKSSSPGISHWNNEKFKDQFINDKLKFDGFLVVEPENEGGRLVTKRISLPMS